MEIVITFIIVSAAWYIYHKNKLHKSAKNNDSISNELRNHIINSEYKINKEVIEKLEVLNNQILDLKKEIIITERESYEKGKKQAEENFVNDFFVQVFPYKRKYKVKSDALLAFKEIEKVEVGYQYQLFVKGCPSLSPAIVVLETYELKQFKLNEDAINNLVNSALGSNTELIGGFLKIGKNLIEKK